MKRATRLVALLTLLAVGCTNNSSKGVNKDQDRPKATADSRR